MGFHRMRFIKPDVSGDDVGIVRDGLTDTSKHDSRRDLLLSAAGLFGLGIMEEGPIERSNSWTPCGTGRY